MKIPGNQAVSQRRKENIVIKKKWTKDKQWSTKQYTETQTTLKIGCELMCSGKGTRRVIYSSKKSNDKQWTMKDGRYSDIDKQKIYVVIYHTDIPEWLTKSLWRSLGTLGSIVSLLAVTLYQWNTDRKHKVCSIISIQRYILHIQVMLEYCHM